MPEFLRINATMISIIAALVVATASSLTFLFRELGEIEKEHQAYVDKKNAEVVRRMEEFVFLRREEMLKAIQTSERSLMKYLDQAENRLTQERRANFNQVISALSGLVFQRIDNMEQQLRAYAMMLGREVGRRQARREALREQAAPVTQADPEPVTPKIDEAPDAQARP